MAALSLPRLGAAVLSAGRYAALDRLFRAAISACSCSIIRARSALGCLSYFARRSAQASSIERRSLMARSIVSASA